MTSDYYPFGYQMQGRHTNDPNYRYGYNGMEKNAEMYGEGNEYSTEFRQYDPRLGRWMSLDPLMADYPSMSPYVAFNDNPVYFVDPLGLEGGKGRRAERKGHRAASRNRKRKEAKANEAAEREHQGHKGKIDEIEVTAKNGSTKMGKKKITDWGHLKHKDALKKLHQLDAKRDDDNQISFIVLGASVGVNVFTFGGSAEIKNIWVNQDLDNIHIHNSGRFYLTKGINGGIGSSGSIAEVSLGVQGGYGFMTNVHPYDDIGQLFENATDFEITFGSGEVSGGMVYSKSEGKSGPVEIFLFFGEWSKSEGTETQMPVQIPIGVAAGIYGKELKRTVLRQPNAADTGKVLIYNPSNNIPPMTKKQIDRMNNILMKKKK
nr:RHS repeat-associated core domain-containing protein [uncultured Flavobacterium sp.]